MVLAYTCNYNNDIGENIEELFTRVAVVAFENVLMKEVEAEATPPPSNGQLAKNSTLIGKVLSRLDGKVERLHDCTNLSTAFW